MCFSMIGKAVMGTFVREPAGYHLRALTLTRFQGVRQLTPGVGLRSQAGGGWETEGSRIVIGFSDKNHSIIGRQKRR